MVSELSRHGWRSSDPPQRPVLFVNPKSGGGKATRAAVAERARERGIETVIFTPGQSLEALVREAVVNGADALGVAGGDGSLAVVAEVAATHGLPFVCVPAGTRNHFALDLGLDPHDVLGTLDGDGARQQPDRARGAGGRSRLAISSVLAPIASSAGQTISCSLTWWSVSWSWKFAHARASCPARFWSPSGKESSAPRNR